MYCEAASCGAFNLFVLLRRWHFSSVSLPLLWTFSYGGENEAFAVGDTVGKGGTVLMLRLEKVECDDWIVRPRIVMDEGFRNAACCTSQQALRRFFEARDRLPAPHDIKKHPEALRVERLNARTIIFHRGLAWKIDGVKDTTALSLKFRLAAPKNDEVKEPPPGDRVGPLGIDPRVFDGDKGRHNDGGDVYDAPAAPQSHDVDAEASDHDAEEETAGEVEALEAERASLAGIASGSRIGIIGKEYALSKMGKCIVCLNEGFPAEVAAIQKDSLDLFRTAPNKVERSMHVACATNPAFLRVAGHRHLEQSCQYLSRAAEVEENGTVRVQLLDICDHLRIALSGASASSGGQYSMSPPPHSGASSASVAGPKKMRSAAGDRSEGLHSNPGPAIRRVKWPLRPNPSSTDPCPWPFRPNQCSRRPVPKSFPESLQEQPRTTKNKFENGAFVQYIFNFSSRGRVAKNN